MRFEHHAFSTLGLFVSAHFRCAYIRTETAGYRFSFVIPECLKQSETPHSFHYEIEPIFAYKAPDLIEVVK